MTKLRPIKRPNPTVIVKDPDLQLSFQQTQDLAHLSPELYRPIIGNVLSPKLKQRLLQEGLTDTSPVIANLWQPLLDASSDYLLAVHLLPILGERTSIRDYVSAFKKQAKKLQNLINESNYSNLVHGLMPGSNFPAAATQAFLLSQSLELSITAATKSLEILNSHQLSVAENSRQHFAWRIADLLEEGGFKLSTDPRSLYVKVLRGLSNTIHEHPESDGEDVLRLARITVRKRKLNAVRPKSVNTVEENASATD